jgi:hypothetical protein
VLSTVTDTAGNARSGIGRRTAMSGRNPLNLPTIVGPMGSASTLLDVLRGNTPALFSGGEPCWIWERGYLKEQPCSRGEPVQGCEFWSEVMARAFGSAGQPVPLLTRLPSGRTPRCGSAMHTGSRAPLRPTQIWPMTRGCGTTARPCCSCIKRSPRSAADHKSWIHPSSGPTSHWSTPFPPSTRE